MDYKEIGRIFFRDGYRLAGQYLEDDFSAVNLAEAIRTLLKSMDELLESFLQKNGQKVKIKRSSQYWVVSKVCF